VGVVADVVLPCLDEVEALPWVLARIPEGWGAIVVDNGSSDGSGEVAARLGARVVHEARRGFGAACHAGLLAARAEFVCFCDCDASLDPALLVDFVRDVADGAADLVIGRRRPTARGAWPPHARAGNLAVARMLRRRTGLRLHDIGPLRAARRTALLGLDVADRRSGYPLETLVRAADAGWRVTEHPVPYHPRTGASKVTGTWRGTWQAVRDMSAVLAAPPHAPLPSPGRTVGEAAPARPGSDPAAVPRPAEPDQAAAEGAERPSRPTAAARTAVRAPAAPRHAGTNGPPTPAAPAARPDGTRPDARTGPHSGPREPAGAGTDRPGAAAAGGATSSAVPGAGAGPGPSRTGRTGRDAGGALRTRGGGADEAIGGTR
jgi:hypothetical protein